MESQSAGRQYSWPIDEEVGRDHVYLGVSRPDDIAAPFLDNTDGGVWNGYPGRTVSWRTNNNVRAYYVDRFGLFQGEYMTWADSPTSYNATYMVEVDSAPSSTTEVDIQARVRVEDWTVHNFYKGGTLVHVRPYAELMRATNSAGGVTGPLFRMNWSNSAKPSPIGQVNVYCSVSTLGLTDNTWGWVRVTLDEQWCTWYSGSPGSWTVVQQDPNPDYGLWPFELSLIPGGVSSVPYRIGNGFNASNRYGSGWGGDISDLTVAHSIGGTPAFDLNMPVKTVEQLYDWPNAGTAGGMILCPYPDVVTTGGTFTPETITVRLDLEHPIKAEDILFFIDVD